MLTGKDGAELLVGRHWRDDTPRMATTLDNRRAWFDALLATVTFDEAAAEAP